MGDIVESDIPGFVVLAIMFNDEEENNEEERQTNIFEALVGRERFC